MAQQDPLPEKYYLEHYQIVLNNVYQKYYHLLLSDEQAFLDILLDLSQNALCLWIRMVNRRKIFFTLKDLPYTEIDIPAAIQELEQNSLLSHLSMYEMTHFEMVLHECKSVELIDILLQITDFTKKQLEKLPKHLLVQAVFDADKVAAMQLLIKNNYYFTELKDLDLFVKYLYFGFVSTDLSPFVVRDLGNVKFEEFDDKMLAPRFQNREDIDICWELEKSTQYFYLLQNSGMPALEIFHWFEDWNRHLKTPFSFDYAQRRYDKLVLKMATLLEKAKQNEYALQVYKLTPKPPSRERQCRILQQIGKIKQAIALCESINQNYQNTDERYFGSYFLQKIANPKTQLPTTQHLKNSPQVNIDKIWRKKPEEGVANYYQNLGFETLHTENWLWRSLLGLLLWDIIFDYTDTAIYSPFQRIPSNFLSIEFYPKRQEKIDTAFLKLSDKTLFEEQITRIYTQKINIANPLVWWHPNLLAFIGVLYQKTSPQALQIILKTMIANPGSNLKGFPDLMIWNENTLQFIEVKAPKDTLSYQQLLWLETFELLGIKAKAEKIIWTETPGDSPHFTT